MLQHNEPMTADLGQEGHRCLRLSGVVISKRRCDFQAIAKRHICQITDERVLLQTCNGPRTREYL
jgi:hypothetical protein